MRRATKLADSVSGLLLLAAIVCTGGCRDLNALESFFKTGWTRFLDASKPLRAPEGSPTNPILPQIGVADRTDERLPNSTLPTEEDYIYDDRDYVIGPTDTLVIGVLDLFVEGQESQFQRQVSATGYIDLPLIDDRIKAQGLNQEEVKEAIRQKYHNADIIQDPVVSVRVTTRGQSRFSLLGQGNQGTYLLSRPDTRLLDALAASGGIPQTTIRYIYVMRHKRPMSRSEAEAKIPLKAATVPTTVESVPAEKPVELPPTALDSALRELDTAMPKADSATKPTQPETLPAPSDLMRLSETGGRTPAASTSTHKNHQFKWAYKNGKWLKVALTARPTPPASRRARPATRPKTDTAARKNVRAAPRRKAARPVSRTKTPPGSHTKAQPEPRTNVRPVASAKARAACGDRARPPAASPQRGLTFKWAYKNGKWAKVALAARPAPAGGRQASSRARPNIRATVPPGGKQRATAKASAPAPRAARPSVPTRAKPTLLAKNKAAGPLKTERAAPPTPERSPIPITRPMAPMARSGAPGVTQARAAMPKSAGPSTGSLRRMPVDDPFGWNKATRSDQVRIIAINLDRLKKGDPRMNVIIKDNDIIYIPPVQIGEFYIMGEVQRPGVYSLTGRRITIKQALAAAGNLGPNAWPENSYLIRRIGESQEQIRAINMEKIVRGEEPDIFLKPEDVIAVGTHFVVPFMQGLRNIVPIFNMAFSYSRNFAPEMEFTKDPGMMTGLRFRRW